MIRGICIQLISALLGLAVLLASCATSPTQPITETVSSTEAGENIIVHGGLKVPLPPGWIVRPRTRGDQPGIILVLSAPDGMLKGTIARIAFPLPVKPEEFIRQYDSQALGAPPKASYPALETALGSAIFLAAQKEGKPMVSTALIVGRREALIYEFSKSGSLSPADLDTVTSIVSSSSRFAECIDGRIRSGLPSFLGAQGGWTYIGDRESGMILGRSWGGSDNILELGLGSDKDWVSAATRAEFEKARRSRLIALVMAVPTPLETLESESGQELDFTFLVDGRRWIGRLYSKGGAVNGARVFFDSPPLRGLLGAGLGF